MAYPGVHPRAYREVNVCEVSAHPRGDICQHSRDILQRSPVVTDGPVYGCVSAVFARCIRIFSASIVS